MNMKLVDVVQQLITPINKTLDDVLDVKLNHPTDATQIRIIFKDGTDARRRGARKARGQAEPMKEDQPMTRSKIRLCDTEHGQHITLTAERDGNAVNIEIMVREAPRRIRRETITVSANDFARLARLS